MIKIRFTKMAVVNGKLYQAGWAAGFRDSIANNLISEGKATTINPAARLLKYQTDAAVSLECVDDNLDDAVESAPKGAEKPKQKQSTNTTKK